jgi:hypothetical protein
MLAHWIMAYKKHELVDLQRGRNKNTVEEFGSGLEPGNDAWGAEDTWAYQLRAKQPRDHAVYRTTRENLFFSFLEFVEYVHAEWTKW